jgi:hypothetical protein
MTFLRLGNSLKMKKSSERTKRLVLKLLRTMKLSYKDKSESKKSLRERSKGRSLLKSTKQKREKRWKVQKKSSDYSSKKDF